MKTLDLSHKGHQGLGAYSEFKLMEGQAITFVLRTPPDHQYPEEARPSKEKAKALGVSFESL